MKSKQSLDEIEHSSMKSLRDEVHRRWMKLKRYRSRVLIKHCTTRSAALWREPQNCVSFGMKSKRYRSWVLIKLCTPRSAALWHKPQNCVSLGIKSKQSLDEVRQSRMKSLRDGSEERGGKGEVFASGESEVVRSTVKLRDAQ